MADYQVLTTTMAGVPYAEIANAAIESITWELNGWGELVFSLPVTDAQAFAELQPAYQTKREVQVWRNGRLIWWGVYVAGSADESTVTFTCFGILWYFSRRYFGPSYTNSMPTILINGGMESSPVTTGWSKTAGATVTGAAGPKYTGNQSMKVVTADAAGVDNHVFQFFAIPTPLRIKPLRWTLRGWLYIESVTTHHPSNFSMVVGVPGSSAEPASRLKEDAPLRQWLFVENEFTLAPGVSGDLAAVLYVPAAGTVYWDDVVVSHDRRTGVIAGEDWSDDYLRRIVNYASGNTGGGSEGPGGTAHDQKSWWGAPINKSSLNITFAGTGGAAAGAPLVDTYWDHYDEANMYEAIAEVAARDILDYEITWPSNGRGARSFTTYVPSKGSTKPGLAIEAGKNLVSYRYDVDGRKRASDVRVSGRGSGTLREAAQTGGPIVVSFNEPQLEDIVQPAFEISGQALRSRADAEWNRRKDPVRVPTLTVAAKDFLDTAAGGPLTVGDSVPVRIDNGWVQEASTRRVVKMTLRPETETLDLVVNA